MSRDPITLSPVHRKAQLVSSAHFCGARCEQLWPLQPQQDCVHGSKCSTVSLVFSRLRLGSKHVMVWPKEKKSGPEVMNCSFSICFTFMENENSLWPHRYYMNQDVLCPHLRCTHSCAHTHTHTLLNSNDLGWTMPAYHDLNALNTMRSIIKLLTPTALYWFHDLLCSSCHGYPKQNSLILTPCHYNVHEQHW